MRGIAKTPELEAARGRKISEARKRRLAETGSLNSPEARAKIAEYHRGRILSDVTKQRMAAAKKGRRPANLSLLLAAAHAAPHAQGEAVANWKGDAVGYAALHAWVRRKLGSPQLCQRCGTTTAKRYEWSNVSREYRRDPSDWIRLCTSCHRKEGFERGEYTIWNKGQKTGLVPRTAFKPGIVANPGRNYLSGRACFFCGVSFHPRNAKIIFCSQVCYWNAMKNKLKNTAFRKET